MNARRRLFTDSPSVVSARAARRRRLRRAGALLLVGFCIGLTAGRLLP